MKTEQLQKEVQAVLDRQVRPLLRARGGDIELNRIETVGIQFCGGCNPRIDRGEIALALRKALADRGIEVVFNRLDADFVIFLSGCTSGCAFKFNPTNPPYVTIAGTTVDNEDVGETRIVPEVLRKVKEFYGASGHF
jgi:hypothetical protein